MKRGWIKRCLLSFGLTICGVLMIQTGALIWFLSRVNTVLEHHDRQIDENKTGIKKNHELIHKIDKDCCE